MDGGGFGGGGDNVIGGENWCQGRRNSDLVKQTAKSGTVRFEESESAKKRRLVLCC